MTTAVDHYDRFLAEHYTWMLGGDLLALAAAQRAHLIEWGVVPGPAGSVAVDLGCGPGHTSLALAGLGFDPVLAVDLSRPLLDELAAYADGVPAVRHNRAAHIGLGLLPSSRGKGYGTDVVAVLCHYGFVVRGLQRLQIETLADNTAMLRSAEHNGFVREGVLRSSAWVMGEFLDEVLLGLLAQDWKPGSKG
ncbi:GNAT family N-acetyltransferase [Streptomyces sp. NPDC006458]|uniref:GNAT family N-acetyltransferase n=1 Tax=Streptomyces sp. NPDC006458 TaxID=3154302 RepID=UPI0033A5401B